jgi:hypothetical protein
MSDDNTQDGAEPSPASAGSHNTHMATARLSAANTWLQEEIKRLRLTGAERERVSVVADWASEHLGQDDPGVVALRALMERLK